MAVRGSDDRYDHDRRGSGGLSASYVLTQGKRAHVVLEKDQRYDEGESSYIEVTAVESEALQTERKLTRSRTEGLLATVRLATALGGGWAADNPAVR